MKQILGTVTWLSRLGTGAAFAVLILAVGMQVLGRSVLADSPVWTEELTRFALLFLAAFGAGLSYRSGDLVNVDLICESLPGRWPLRLRFVSALATAFLCILLLMPAWTFASIGALQTSPALGWRMTFIHGSILVLLVSLAVFSVLRAIGILIGEAGPDAGEGEAR
ncbi:TRAP transporter small permease [Nitratireductor sp. ZSWI3]|uniref:TRAP transporter small permease n=1 Tax=Nitratireductor sp. ZSWI3 TaxID=2966359 RepID=UPI0021502CA0|nr:TRAP transporter small permease [Nitratireductor sp. ZSWI3]MCR4264629.1 TRAP transporter small permease [Nitratireductor sp. ZSWI3]